MKEKHRSEKLHFVMATKKKEDSWEKKTNNPKFNIQIMLEASRNLLRQRQLVERLEKRVYLVE